MPFIGRDWRSPGEAWVKTESLGWQRMKIIESQLYLTCQQNHSTACSWPPRSQFGQHMEQNCNKQTNDSDDGEHQAMGSGSGASSGSSTPSSSLSTSPTGSPAKNNSRHIHPITISSPYGQYFASFCAHHQHANNGSIDKAVIDCHQHQHNNGNHHHHHHHHHHHLNQQQHFINNNDAQMSRSLSRETIISSPTNCYGCSSSSTSKPILRYNNSVSDFRKSASDDFVCQPTSLPDQTSKITDSQFSDTLETTITDSATVTTTSCGFPQMVVFQDKQLAQIDQSSAPILLENGRQIERKELPGNDDDYLDATLTTNPAKSTEPTKQSSSSLSSSPSISPPPQSPPKQDVDRNSCGSCCCSNQQCFQSTINSHHHLMTEMQQPKTAPHCRISVRTREVAMHNTISEAFYRLDFYNAIHDIRRFNYICKLLHLLITQNLTSLSGCATRVLFLMLEQVAWEVSSNKRNVHVIRNLLYELKQTIQKYYCWGRPIGSSLLWQQHFETIERISQIVNGIELSPSKSDSYNITFDKLPVEMIREILLRLNDHRDLINSAQASPVMRTMIDSQYIWKKLCSYHFTEQQLKLALESNSNLHTFKRNSLSGVNKYARTTSADGRSSYRNPVAHRTSSSSVSPTPSPTLSKPAQSTSSTTPRQQLEQTSAGGGGRRNSNNNRRNSGSSQPSSAKSYVTNAVKILDDRERGSTTTSAPKSNRKCSTTTSIAGSSSEPSTSTGSRHNVVDRSKSGETTKKEVDRRLMDTNDCGQSMNSERSSFETDWELIFHQLRKRFDLKEEYADCLLLCRHCRCLFWKSFGHPCIKSDDTRQQENKTNCQASSLDLLKSSVKDNCQHKCNDCNEYYRQNQPESRDKSTGPSNNRPSVASLSRNFDNQARPSSSNIGDSCSSNCMLNENTEQLDNRPGNSQNSHIRQQRPAATSGQRQRQPLGNLNAQLREHNSNRQQRLQNPSNGRDIATTTSARREELVPKHVTITPQAFLKFFSL